MQKKSFVKALFVVLLVMTGSVMLPFCCDAKQITVSLAGDCSIGKLATHSYANSFNAYYDQYGPAYFFQNVKPIFDADDMTLVNFEGVLTNSNNPVPKTFNIKGSPAYIAALPLGGIDAVTFGNNHRIDYGNQGILDTISAFDSIHMPYAYNEHLGIFNTKQGVKVGYVSVCVLDGVGPSINYVQNGILALRECGCNVVLVCPHWGEEKEHYPTKEQIQLGHSFIDMGADLVVGCHPHVLQGIDYYNGKYILYSLGNFSFGANKNPKDKKTMIARVTFTVDDEKNAVGSELSVIPCMISSTDHHNDYCPTPCTNAAATDIINRMNAYSKAFHVSILENGCAVHPEKGE